MKPVIWPIALSLILSACGSKQIITYDREGLIGDQTFQGVPQEDIQLEAPSIDSVIDHYQDVLALSDDPGTKISVLHRLADLRLIESEEKLVDNQESDLSVAIEAYEALIREHPERAANDELLYQLAKSYSLQGDLDSYLDALDDLIGQYPDSPHASEVQFRRGERLFSLGDYEEAQLAFNDVIERADPALLASAWYMKGWSQFKQSFYEEALDSYFEVMRRVIPSDIEEARNSPSNRTLIDDLVRVSGLCFNYLDRANTVAAFFKRHGNPPFEEFVYERYGEMLEDKETYSDAIDLYDRYREEHPFSISSPTFLTRSIDTMRKAGFISQIFARKEEYVELYAFNTPFWLSHSEFDLESVKTTLKQLLPELGDFYYAQAQSAKEVSGHSSFASAASYYLSYINTFPDGEATPDIHFLLAESYFQYQDLPKAIEAYEFVGYRYESFDQANEAAYAALLQYPNQIKKLSSNGSPEVLDWEARYLQSQLDFVEFHAEDSRAPSVLFAVMQSAYDKQQYAVSNEKAKQLLAWPSLVENQLSREAQLIEAHSLFALEDYAQAELAYKKSLVLLAGDAKRQKETSENIAASIYRQAEGMLETGRIDEAIDELLRVGQVVPNASLRATAEYDAGIYLIESQSWPRAIEVLLAFETNFPKDSRSKTIPPKLALAYRETGQLKLAAEQTQRMAASSQDTEEQRQYFLLAAELFDQGEHTQQAILAFRYYANTYPEPSLEYMNAANRLAQLYDQTGDVLKNRFWLAKQMKRVDQLKTKASAEEIYLAAQAAAVLANDAYRKFAAAKLTLPLANAMKSKTETMTNAINAYQKVANYGVSDLRSEAGYQMGEIYAQLSRDLLDSERPANLDELALEQYDILLEEEAFPFEDNAIAIHEQNIEQVLEGRYDEWIRKSFAALSVLLPGRYDKKERGVGYDSELR